MYHLPFAKMLDQTNKHFGCNVGKKNYQRDKCCGFQHHVPLQLIDHDGKGHRAGIIEECNSRNGDHGIDKEIAEHFCNGVHSIGDKNIPKHPQPPNG